MKQPFRILLQTTIPVSEDDWSIDRFSLLHEHLALITDRSGEPRYRVTARNRVTDSNGNDEVLSNLDTTDFHELWLIAVDSGNGLSLADCQGITRFRQRGGGILATRDHQDLGSSLCTLGGVGRAHFFIQDILIRTNQDMCGMTRTPRASPGPTITRAATVTIKGSIQSHRFMRYCEIQKSLRA